MENLKVEQIERLVRGADREELLKMIPELLRDKRATVRRIGEKLIIRLKKEEQEIERINKMKETEERLRREGYRVIAGIDEAGRGPLAGPVVAAVVILPQDFTLKGVNDSKKLTPLKRLELYSQITEKAVDYGVGTVSSKEIDRLNILQATYKAIQLALAGLKCTPDCLLLDALTLPGCSVRQKKIVKGDEKCFSIAAASIIAKVERDRLMDNLHKLYPIYNFLSNKGYGTKEHIQAIKKYGPCPVHRRTFIRKFMEEE